MFEGVCPERMDAMETNMRQNIFENSILSWLWLGTHAHCTVLNAITLYAFLYELIGALWSQIDPPSWNFSNKKKNQKNIYTGQFKMHGTKFLASNTKSQAVCMEHGEKLCCIVQLKHTNCVQNGNSVKWACRCTRLTITVINIVIVWGAQQLRYSTFLFGCSS